MADCTILLRPDPNTSEPAKEKARAILEGEADPSDYAPGTGDAHTNRVLGGYKATLKSELQATERRSSLSNARIYFHRS